MASAKRREEFETFSGLPLAPLYGPEGAIYPRIDSTETAQPADLPGEYPYLRGPYASMYLSRLWTMRMFAGFGTAKDTNERFQEILAGGGDGLSVAFDLPTLMGRDSDDLICEGEVGKCGVALDTIEDMKSLFDGVDVSKVTTSMTINSPAPVVLAMYIKNAEERGIERGALGGTLQNDILKEYQAQKEYYFPPRPSVRLVSDVIRYCAGEMPKWHPVSVSGYHIREAGSTAAQELAFTLANGFAYVEAGISAGLQLDEFVPRLSFFFNAHIDFFEEIAKYRAARRIWARWMRVHYGARSDISQRLRFHTQTSGVSLTAQQPELNIVRTAIEALAGVLGGTQSLHTNSMDEVFSLPTEKAARIALRTQQVIAHETGVANVIDPLGGSYFLEAMTDELERRAEEIFAQILAMGEGSILDGVLRGIEDGYFSSAIADAAFELEKKLADGRRIVVGVNAYVAESEDPIDVLHISSEAEKSQKLSLSKVRSMRNQSEVTRTLRLLKGAAAAFDVNTMPFIIDAVAARATIHEVMETLAEVFGYWKEIPRV